MSGPNTFTVVELDAATVHALTDLATDGGTRDACALRIGVELEPSAERLHDGTLVGVLKVSVQGGTWTLPLGQARLRVGQLYTLPSVAG